MEKTDTIVYNKTLKWQLLGLVALLGDEIESAVVVVNDELVRT